MSNGNGLERGAWTVLEDTKSGESTLPNRFRSSGATNSGEARNFAPLKSEFTYFQSDVSGIDLPKQFDFPFYYTPHELARIASAELQEYLRTQRDWEHDFGMDADSPPQACGKMFGVLVVKNAQGELGYLRAFSGKMANTNVLEPFVPPVYDTLVDGDFYKQGEAVVNKINAELESLLENPALDEMKAKLLEEEKRAQELIAEHKQRIQSAKKIRDQRRVEAAETLSPEEMEALEIELRKESTHLSYQLKKLKASSAEELQEWQNKIDALQGEIDTLKETRKEMSASLQRQIFEQFQFLNAEEEHRSLYDIFKNTVNENPPAGAGDCAAPKLLHYAYQHGMHPLCMAEFWWGRPPRNEVRKHLQFYTSCRGKCEPILGHMLKGLDVQENPMLQHRNAPGELDILYEDEYMLAVNKPHEFLSVPGKTVEDSVYTRVKEKYPEATGPLIVHRLDMSTSGILLLAKTRIAHKALQHQFKKRTVHKTYLAVLEGELNGESGVIDLPLRVDLNDRPRQLVCFEHGKKAVTKWKVLEHQSGETLIQFHPITGRTHQLRVHAAHADGLGIAIKGDDLYGTMGDRLYLHAAKISFIHPMSGEKMELEAPVGWREER